MWRYGVCSSKKSVEAFQFELTICWMIVYDGLCPSALYMLADSQHHFLEGNAMPILIAFVVSLFMLLSVIPAHSAVFNIPSADVTALIDAINMANANGEDNTINLEAGTYSLTAIDNIVSVGDAN